MESGITIFPFDFAMQKEGGSDANSKVIAGSKYQLFLCDGQTGKGESRGAAMPNSFRTL